MNIKCPHCDKVIEDIKSVVTQEKEKEVSWEIDKSLTDFNERYRKTHGDYPNRERMIKHLSSKGFTYRSIGAYFHLSPERIRQLNNDLYPCDSCGKLVKRGDKSTHKPDCKRYEKSTR